jgi:SAM-dependent methyltransferase
MSSAWTNPIPLEPMSSVTPARIFEALNAYQRSAALAGAIQLDLFTHLGEQPATAVTLAGDCKADSRAMRILCDCLVVDGYLTKSDDRYALTPLSKEYLDRRSPHWVGSAARFMQSPDLWRAFSDVAAVVRNGGTLLPNQGTTQADYAGWVEFARSMAPLMSAPAAFLTGIVERRMKGAIQILDIAAGHGQFGIHIAQANPQARVTALDWEAVLCVARENAAKAGVEDRFHVRPGDALNCDYGGPYDVILVTNFLHHFGREECLSVWKKIANALARPTGLVLTLEFIPNSDRVSPVGAATFALTMLGTTRSGDAYTFDAYSEMARAAGLTRHELLDVPESIQRVIISQW